MFTNKTQLQKRTPENGTDRENFLSLLVDEYLNSSSYDAKCQVLANLANFAYDPINYAYIRDVGVLDIFLHVLKNETCDKLLHFACAGICNLCIDPLNATYIQTHIGLKIFTGLLSSKCDELIADTITILMYFYSHQTKPQINTPEVIQMIQKHKDSENKIVSNLAEIFLQDVCSSE